MKESIGSTASLNIALAFIAIVFAFLAAALSYYKAFKVNNVITNSLEKFEGFNNLAKQEINNKLDSLGYQRFNTNCPKTKSFGGKNFTLDDSESGYCVYRYSGQNVDPDDYYDQYGITTYMTINLPIISDLVKIPINTTSHEIYRCYGGKCDNGSD